MTDETAKRDELARKAVGVNSPAVARGAVVVIAMLALLAVARVAATFEVLSETADEPSHVAAGFQWLTSRTYDLDPEHPPLARIAFALEPFLTGAHVNPADHRTEQGNAILYRNGAYRRNLAMVRAPNLVFLVLLVAVVSLWTWRLSSSRGAAVVAAALLVSLPPILGHAGLATTDLAAAATTVTAAYVLSRWLTAATWEQAVVLGLAVGAGLVAKFSFLAFFSAAAIAMVAFWRRSNTPFSRLLTQGLVVVGIATLVVWATYKFDTGTLNDARMKIFADGAREYVAAKYARVPGYAWVRPDLLERFYAYVHRAEERGVPNVDFVDWAKAAGYPSPLAGRRGNTMAGAPRVEPPSYSDRWLEPFRRYWQWIGVNMTVPAPLFIVGAEYVARHSREGHPAFLLGDYRDKGWWYYFPVLLFFKTPVPLFVLATVGLPLLYRKGRDAAALALAPVIMLLPAMKSAINIGVRHVLPVYPFLVMAAAFAVVTLWSLRARAARGIAAALLVWYFAGVAYAHPDYLAYFNECAGNHPELIATDSNLDWGQDLLRLAGWVHANHIDHLYISYFGSADWRRHLPQAEELPRWTRVHGWIAISEMQLTFGGPTNRGDGFHWLQHYRPYARIGKSIRIYSLP